jgi:hypothetical protein
VILGIDPWLDADTLRSWVRVFLSSDGGGFLSEHNAWATEKEELSTGIKFLSFAAVKVAGTLIVILLPLPLPPPSPAFIFRCQAPHFLDDPPCLCCCYCYCYYYCYYCYFFSSRRSGRRQSMPQRSRGYCSAITPFGLQLKPWKKVIGLDAGKVPRKVQKTGGTGDVTAAMDGTHKSQCKDRKRKPNPRLLAGIWDLTFYVCSTT